MVGGAVVTQRSVPSIGGPGWSTNRYSSAPASRSTPASLTSFATPITVCHGLMLVPIDDPRFGRSRCPIGSRPFHSRLASVSLTMTTRPPEEVSRASKPRPATIGIRIVVK